MSPTADEPAVQILWHRKTCRYYLMHLAIDPEYGFLQAFGPLEEFTSDRMREEGLSRVMWSFNEFHRRDLAAETDPFVLKSKEEQRQFDHDHLAITVARIAPDVLRFSPLHSKPRGGRVGVLDEADALDLRLPITPVEFFDALKGAFGRSS